MSYGLIGTGRSLAGSAEAGMSQSAGLEHSRNMMQRQLEQAASAQKKATVGSLAGAGAQYGLTEAGGAVIAGALGPGGMVGAAGLPGLTGAASMAGPWGALIGAGIGLLIGELF